MKREEAEQIAKAITKELFIGGTNPPKARRLVMEKETPLNGAGWCETAVEDIIVAHLTKTS